MKNKFVIMPVIMFVLLVCVVIAQEDWGDIYKVSPTITLDFTDESDEVFIDDGDFNLTNSTGGLVDYFDDPVESPTKKFTFSPKSGKTLKDNEDYTFTVKYHDDVPNYRVSTYTFTIKYPDVNITLFEPTFGVSSETPFDFIINTDRAANCRYSKTSDKPFDDMTLLFERISDTEHKVEDFTYTGTVYVRCKDDYETETLKTFSLSVDDTPPDVTLSADDVVEETSPGEYSTTLVAVTDKDSVCRYKSDDSDVDYEDMDEFPDYDESEESSYKTTNEKELNQEVLVDGDINRYYVKCKGKSGLLSLMEAIDINVDTEREPTITANSPPRYTDDTTPFFNVSTNKDATCELYTDSGLSDKVGVMSGTEKVHQLQMVSALSPGTYTYYVKCIFDIEGDQPSPEAVTFSIDDSAPTMSYVNLISPLENESGKTYKDDELDAEWEAEDNESDIEKYAYYVFWDKSTDELIGSGKKDSRNDNEYEISDITLNDSERYYLKVSAKNNIGLWSSNMTSGSILVDISLSPAVCRNLKKDGDETDIDCGGSCLDCANGESCRLDSDCVNDFCNSSNKCASPSCDDDVRNGRETDVDCGGNCRSCDVNKYCSKDSDCKTNNCDASTEKCAETVDSCENNRLDVDETDTDCGGSCPGCGVGEDCDSDSDCISTTECKNGECTLKPVDSDGDGIDDDTDNCQDNANADQADVDSDGIGDACDLDSDNDDLPDSFEQQYFDCVTCVDPYDDPDGDGLTNLDESKYNTNPTKKDTDGDGADDDKEINNGTDPLDPSSKPGGGFFKYLLIVIGLGVLGAGGYFGYTALKKKKKPFIPPAAARVPARKPRQPIRAPIRRPFRQMLKPLIPRSHLPRKPVKIGRKIVKPSIKKLEKKKKGDIFERLSKIAKTERIDQVEKNMKSLKMTDKELKSRINKLKKELKMPVRK